ncbi:hypothetical protein QFC24_004671 [Naganishia onofrii]|uniref:Uncharacterized protein n=1 Tax=Naganishia onofrii TaxID=1851511 RepID=A0ACC2XD88_9TREE|nr:hypothetical protein QFC24_004671 [Naganishia onofrii]
MEVDDKPVLKNGGGYPQRHAATPNPDRERTVPLSAGPATINPGSTSGAGANTNSTAGPGSLVKGSPPTVLSDLDPDTIPREFKKEGAEWFAVWNPRNKKTLNVDLVHTLVHESPDGKFLATGAEDRQIRIWDIAKGRIKHLLVGHNQEIYSLDFSQDGQFLVSGSGDKSARIWDISTGHCVYDLHIEDPVIGENGLPIDAGITSVALSPDSKLVAAGSLDTIVRVWDTRTGQQLERLRGHKDSVYSVAFSPDGNSLVSGSLDKSLRVWDLRQTNMAVDRTTQQNQLAQTGLGVLQQTLVGHKDYVLSVGITPDGQWIVSGSKDRSIQFWQADGQAQFLLQGHKNSGTLVFRCDHIPSSCSLMALLLSPALRTTSHLYRSRTCWKPVC